MILSLIILIVFFFFKKKKSIFQIESGFQNLSKTSLKTFSINFFFILILFIIFDLELILLMSFFLKKNFNSFFLINFFLIFTLWYEWSLKNIKWKN